MTKREKALSKKRIGHKQETTMLQPTLKSNVESYEPKFDLQKPNLAFYKPNNRLQTDTNV